MAALTRSPVAVEIRPLPLTPAKRYLPTRPQPAQHHEWLFFGGSHADDLLPDYVTDKTFTFYLSYTRYYRCVM